MVKNKSLKNGFTLAELLAAITILAILSLITMTTVSHFLKQGKDDLYQKQLNNIKLAAKTWASDHKDEIGECYSLSLEDLQKSNLVDDDIKDPRTGDKLKNIKVKITKEGKIFKYEINPKVVCYKSYSVGEKITINDEEYYVIDNSSSTQEYITVFKKISLLIGDINQYGENHFNQYVSSYNGKIHNSYGYVMPGMNCKYERDMSDDCYVGSVAYYSTETCSYPRVREWVEDGCSTNYAVSDVRIIVDNWAADNFGIDDLISINGYKARLIKLDELVNNLGCTNNDCRNTKYSWPEIEGHNLYSPSSFDWTMTSIENSTTEVYGLSRNGDILPYRVAGGGYNNGNFIHNFGSIRPVINIKKSAIEGGNNNE